MREFILQDPTTRSLSSLIHIFQQIVRKRRGQKLEEWLTASENSKFVELHNFENELCQDYADVQAALTEEWSNEQTEGQNARLKLLKRQMVWPD